MTAVIRIVVILAVVLVVIVAVRLIGRWQRPSHPIVDLGGLANEPGVIVFTSTDCVNCREALAVVESLGLSPREVAWEAEPGVFEPIGVEAVPLTVVVNADHDVELQVAGVPRRGSLRRAAVRAGLIE